MEDDPATSDPRGQLPVDPANELPRDTSNHDGNSSVANSDLLGSAAIRPVFLGNLKNTYNADDVMALFHQPIHPPGIEPGTFKPMPIERLDQKRGYCFVYLKDAVVQEDKDNAERFVEAISGMELEGVSVGLRAEFAKGDGRIKRKEDDRRRDIQPSETLFVVNFPEDTTRREDLKMLFEPYGELIRIDMKRNYAFIQFRSVDDATKAKEVTNGGKLNGHVLTVEYVARQRSHVDRRDGGGGRGGRGGGRFRRDDRDGYRDRRGPPRYRDRDPPLDRSDRDRGRDPYDYDRGGRRDDYRRSRSPVGGYRGRRSSRSRSRSPIGASTRYYDHRDRSPVAYEGRSAVYRSRSPERVGRYDDKDRVGRYDDYPSSGRAPRHDDYPSGRDGYSGRGRSPDPYRGGRDDRGYRG